MHQVAVVELMSAQVVAVLARPQLGGLDAVGLQKQLIGHCESLAHGLGDDLRLWRDQGARNRGSPQEGKEGISIGHWPLPK